MPLLCWFESARRGSLFSVLSYAGAVFTHNSCLCVLDDFYKWAQNVVKYCSLVNPHGLELLLSQRL